MSKMGSHDPFGHLKHKLCPKEGPGVKLAIYINIFYSSNHVHFNDLKNLVWIGGVFFVDFEPLYRAFTLGCNVHDIQNKVII
jgi:hypothetical protein